MEESTNELGILFLLYLSGAFFNGKEISRLCLKADNNNDYTDDNTYCSKMDWFLHNIFILKFTTFFLLFCCHHIFTSSS